MAVKIIQAGKLSTLLIYERPAVTPGPLLCDLRIVFYYYKRIRNDT